MVSDLATVTKTEKRRLTAYPDNESYSGMLSLVQRYKYEVLLRSSVLNAVRFLDLIPCSAAELESFARPDDRKARAGGREFSSGGSAKGFARPDVSQMVPTSILCCRLKCNRLFTRLRWVSLAIHVLEMGECFSRPAHGLVCLSRC